MNVLLKTKNIYTLHEQGAPSHFFALDSLCNQNSIKLNHREFNFYQQLGASIKYLDYSKLFKFFINIAFFFNLIFTKNKIVILALAPYSYKLVYLRYILKKHKTFYILFLLGSNKNG
jgi:hypothetical protein